MTNHKNKVFVYIAFLLAVVMIATGCSLNNAPGQPTATPMDLSVDTMIIGYSEHFTTLNPFFADTTTNVDMDIVNLTQVFLMDVDDFVQAQTKYSNSVATIELITVPSIPTEIPRESATPETPPEATPGESQEATPEATPGESQEATPETTPETTPGATLPQRYEGKTVYRITLKEDLFTAEGKKLDIDDLIFNMYVMCDISYDGQYQFGTLPITGFDEYRYGYNQEIYTKYSQVVSNIVTVAPETEDLGPYAELFTEEQFDSFWTVDFEVACRTYMNRIVDHINSDRTDDTNLLSGIPLAMYKCGLAYVTEDGTLMDVCQREYDMDVELPGEEDFIACMKAQYGYDLNGLENMYGEISFTDIFTEEFVIHQARQNGEITDTNNSITGINKLGTYTMELILDSYSVIDWLYFVFPIMPMEYYGNVQMYDYEKGSFGFTKGDISQIRKCDKYPLGAGPYKYEQTADGMIRLTDNLFYTGDKAFEVKTILMYLNSAESEKYTNPVSGIIDGTYDVCMAFEGQEGYDSLIETDTLGVREATGYKLVFSKERIIAESMPVVLSDYTTWLRHITNVKMK